MNMYNLEKVSRAQMDEMLRESRDAKLLREAAPSGRAGRGLYLALAGVALAALFAAVLILSVATI